MKGVVAQTFEYGMTVTMVVPLFFLLFVAIIWIVYSREQKSVHARNAELALHDGEEINRG